MCRYASHNPVARPEPGRALLLGDGGDAAADLAGGRSRGTWAFTVEPIDDDTSRFVVRSRGASVVTRRQGPIQFVLQRRAMRGIQERAEERTLAHLEPIPWLATAALWVGACAQVLFQREGGSRPLAVAAGALSAHIWVMFRQPPVSVGPVAALALALIAAPRAGAGRAATVPAR